MATLVEIQDTMAAVCAMSVKHQQIKLGELTLEIEPLDIKKVCEMLRDHANLKFDTLIDICAVDYLDYGVTQWVTHETTSTGFSRAKVAHAEREHLLTWDKPRFAVVYHLLSTELNHRLRLKCFLSEDHLMIDSVNEIWNAANWFEREAFDLYGILFNDHPDLRRILTDYGFIGHPFRKDFPLIGQVEMRYDATLKRCIYRPVSIQSRTLVPKVIRDDSRYLNPQLESQQNAN